MLVFSSHSSLDPITLLLLFFSILLRSKRHTSTSSPPPSHQSKSTKRHQNSPHYHKPPPLLPLPLHTRDKNASTAASPRPLSCSSRDSCTSHSAYTHPAAVRISNPHQADYSIWYCSTRRIKGWLGLWSRERRRGRGWRCHWGGSMLMILMG